MDLELHHVDPTQKVSHSIWSWTKEKRDKEAAKCKVLCFECHKKESANYCRALFTKPITHGIVAGYLSHGCRCDVCKTFYKKWRRNKYLRIKK